MTEYAGSKRLKVLFFSQRFPYPMDTGGKIRTGKLLEQLKNVFDITLVSNVESPKDDRYLDRVKNLCTIFHPVPWKEVRKYTFRFYLRLLKSLFSRYPYTVINDYSKEIERVLLQHTTSERFDLLICDFLQPTLNFKRLTGVPTLLFQHNIESVIPRRHYEISRNPLAKLFWWIQWRRMERYERDTCHRFSATMTVSETDKKCLEEKFGADNVYAIPTGVDTDYFTPSKQDTTDNNLVFVGSLDWLPNEDAILFFIRNVFSEVKSRVPGVTFTVVGRNPSAFLLKELKVRSDVIVTGRVEDVRPYIASSALFVLPLRVGGGTRIKVYEAMAMGKVVVSTTIGVEGLPVRHGEHVVINDDPAELANAIVWLLNDATARKTIECNARRYVTGHCAWIKIGQMFAETCRSVVDRSITQGCGV